MAAALSVLPNFDVQSLVLEGGARVQCAAWDEGVVDYVQLYVAPVWLGEAGVPFLGDCAFSLDVPDRAQSRTAWTGRPDRRLCSPASLKRSGSCQSLTGTSSGFRLAIQTPLGAELREGESVAVNGVCLTATTRDDGGLVGGHRARNRPGHDAWRLWCRASRSTSNAPCAPTADSAATSSRGTSTATGVVERFGRMAIAAGSRFVFRRNSSHS